MDETDTADTIIRPRGLEVLAPTALATIEMGGAPAVLLRRSEIDADTVVGARATFRKASDLPVLVPIEPHTPAQPPPVTAVLRTAFIPAHRVSINGGESVSLEVPQVIGRNPRPPRVITGAAPRLVAVASARGEVSATHLEVSQVGASIVITDLRSTNGTVVVMPGSAPVSMRAGESVVVAPGTIIEIGDGNRIEVLLPPRLRPSDQSASELLR